MGESQENAPSCGVLRRQPIFNRELETVATALTFLSCDPQSPSTPAALEQGLRLLNEVTEDPVFGTLPTVVEVPAQSLDGLLDLPWPLPTKILRIKGGETAIDDYRGSLAALAQQGFEYILDHGTGPSGMDLKPKFWAVKGKTSASDTTSSPVHAALWSTQIATREEFQGCVENPSTTWFSGRFWKRPEFKAQRSLPASQVGSLRLLAQLQNPDVNVNDVERIISCDTTLTYKLLKLLNSAFFVSPSRVESIHNGVNFFGLQRIKNWATVIVMNSVDFRPREILPLGAYRARLAETLAQALKRPNAPQYYLVGLFSVLDALFDCEMEQLITPLNLHEEIAHALIVHEGPYGGLLKWVISVENGQPDWSDESLPLQGLDLMRMQLEAQIWANEFCRCLRG